MKVSLISKLLCILFTIPGALLFLGFAGLLNIFIFEIDVNNYFPIPTISKNNYFSLDDYEIFNLMTRKNTFLKNAFKANFNILMIVLFWIQHIVLSNKNFKNFMEKYFHYHAFERGLYTLTSDLLCFFLVFHWQPITIEILDLSVYPVIKYLWLFLGLSSLTLFTLTLPFMMKIDLLGLKNMVNLFIENDNDKLNLFQDVIMFDPVYKICRHPMQAGFIGMFIFSSANYNLGRLIFSIVMIAGILIGVNEEEIHLHHNEKYKEISYLVKNKFLPNFSNLFSDEFIALEKKLNEKKD